MVERKVTQSVCYIFGTIVGPCHCCLMGGTTRGPIMSPCQSLCCRQPTVPSPWNQSLNQLMEVVCQYCKALTCKFWRYLNLTYKWMAKDRGLVVLFVILASFQRLFQWRFVIGSPKPTLKDNYIRSPKICFKMLRFCVLVQLLMSCQAKLVKYRDEAVEAEELVNHLTQQVRWTFNEQEANPNSSTTWLNWIKLHFCWIELLQLWQNYKWLF